MTPRNRWWSWLPCAAAACLFATCQNPRPVADLVEATAAADPGAALYHRHCAVCHGADGAGDTLVASLLVPRPTAFANGLFKLVGSKTGMPGERDLVAMLQRGMPGSTMMAFDWLPEADLVALAQHVRTLAVRGRATAIASTAAAVGRPLTPAQAQQEAERQLQPGPAIELSLDAPADAATLAAGEALFTRHCANCHGQDGRGLPGSHEWPTDGTWLWPRDFTTGVLRGAPTVHELGKRIAAGMPGAHMPPTTLADAELRALAVYTAAMIPEAARSQHVQWRRTLRVGRLPTLPADDDTNGFANLEPVRLPLVPLRWHPDACQELWLQAAHDGTTLLLRLSWEDGSADLEPRPERRFGDGVAVQFADGLDPPLFVMGSDSAPVRIWRWRTFDPKGTAGQLDLSAPPHGGLDVPIGGRQPAATAELLTVAGLHSVGGATGSGVPLTATASWRDGRWTVTFRRPLRSDEDAFVPGRARLFALAVWDGSQDHDASSKAIGTWHVLDLQP